MAYSKTGDKIFLQAIQSVLDGLEQTRLHEGGYLTGGSKRNGGRRAYDLSLAVSLGNSAALVPEALAARLRQVASINDEIFAKSHSSVGGGNLWSNAYGGSPLAGTANVWMLRFRQVQQDIYRRAVLEAAGLYCNQDVDLRNPLWPGTMGSAILLLLNAHELTGDNKYLLSAEDFAQQSLRQFLSGESPLPKASHVHDHYEAVTNGDTLMIAILRLWQTLHRAEIGWKWLDCDR